MRFCLFVAALLGAASLHGEEVSAFNNSSNSTNAPAQAISNVQADLGEARQNIEGMQSVVAGLSESNQKLNMRISDVESLIKDDINVQISQIKKSQEEQSEKIDKLTAAVTALGEALNTKTAAKEQKPAKNEAKTEKKADKADKKESKKEQKAQVDFADMELLDVLTGADKSFNAKKYDDAKKAFEYLISKNYKPAYSNYMLGEIAYAKKQYDQAIPYYKASVNLFDRGAYMPRLLYHTAISHDKIGRKDDANKFYAALKSAYPDSQEAKAAPTRK